MVYQPQEMVLTQTILFNGKVHRDREPPYPKDGDRQVGNRVEWLTRCGTTATSHIYLKDDGSTVHASFQSDLSTIWAWQAHLLGFAFCRRCFPPEDQPTDVEQVNFWDHSAG